jgi:hypothetical protein
MVHDTVPKVEVVPEVWSVAIKQARADIAASQTTQWSVIRDRLVAELNESDTGRPRTKA